jgi:TctA family transporter
MKDLLALVGGAIPGTAAFVLVRNRFNLEDEEFLAALTAACAAAALVSIVLAGLLRRRVRRSLLLGLGAIVLVPVLFIGWLIVYFVGVCLIGGETCYA